ncbi:ankyrin repeats (3 copies) domain-containing protein [Ditylenchus destructor]|nr:ankyrin repeats (3 copies) domain-containing protein [Ditylenchus destructor]
MMFSSRASIPIIFRSFIIAGSLLDEFVIAPNSADVLSEERAALQRGALTWPWDLRSTDIHPSHITKNPPGYEDAVRNSYTDLHLAAYGGKNEVIEGLIKPGTDMVPETKGHVKPEVDINAKTKDGKTVLSLAVAYGHDKIVKLLLENGASTWMPKDYSYQLSLLDVAVISGNTETVKHLIDTGKFDLNEHLTYAHNITVLHRAVLCPNLEMVKLLISRGADVNYRDINGNHVVNNISHSEAIVVGPAHFV